MKLIFPNYMKKLSITLILILSVIVATAQERSDELVKQVEVTKNYIPDVNKATKLSVAPRMVDTVSLRPEIDYSITSTAWLGNFGITAINPVKLSSTSFKTPPFLYLKAGLGYPSGTVLDAYYVGGDGETSMYGASINHSGGYGKVTNDLGNSIRSTALNSEFSVFGAKIWDRIELGGNIDYNYDLFTDYGQFQISDKPLLNFGPLNASTIGYQTPEASIWFGNDFSNMDLFNFRVTADAYYLKDNADNAELGFNAGVKLGKRFAKRHTLLFALDYDVYSGKDLLDEYLNSIVSITPQYKIETPKFLMNLGAEIAIDNMDGHDTKVRVLPKFDMELKLYNSYVVPFITIEGNLHSNNFKNNMTENPYILPLPMVENSEFYDLMAGVKGNFTPATEYKFNIGYSILRDYHVVANLYEPGSTSRFVHVPSLTDDGGCFTVGGEVIGRINSRFFYDVSANYYNYAMDRVEHASGRANYDAQLNFNYAFSDSFRAKLGTKLIGDRYFYVLDNATVVGAGIGASTPTTFVEKVNPVVDLNVGLDVDVSRRTTMFLEANNILGSKLYQYNHYKSIGLSCILGVKIAF